MIKTFKSNPKNNYFAPEWDFKFYETKFDDINTLEEIKELILQKEQWIINQFPNVAHDGGTGLGPYSLTARYPHFNIFNWQEAPFKLLQQFIRDEHSKFLKELQVEEQPLHIGCWANVMRQGQRIKPHWHSCFADSYLGGHFIVSTENTSTFYQNPYNPNDIWEFVNEPGKLTLFPSHLIHWTNQYDGNSERITVAFDLLTDNYFKSNPISHYVPFSR